MKKLLLIIFLFCSFVAKSQNQDTPPTGSNFKSGFSHSISYFVTDSSVWMFKGAYGWNKLVTNRGLKFKIDSIMGLNNGSYKLKNDSTNSRSGYTTLFRNGLKLNISDTALMLAHYAKISGLLLKLNISDTALMLNSYAKNIALALRLKLSDTASMLAPYAKNITVAGKVDKVTGRQLSQRNYTPTDSTKLAGLYQPQTYELSGINGQTTYIIPFTLGGTSIIYINGSCLSIDLWSGINTTSITINGDIRLNDKIKIQK